MQHNVGGVHILHVFLCIFKKKATISSKQEEKKTDYQDNGEVIFQANAG